MKAILKPFFALCGLVALSTALSADSRLFPAGGGGAGWGEPGFLYSDYLQTAAASGREVEFQGSFVLDNRRPFLAELGTAFPGRVVDEVKSLPLREWGLGYVFEKRRPAHQRALLERGWRLADWLAEETLMAATESSRGGGLIRTLEFDLQSELGGRRAQVGLNVLGALRESNDEAIAWQFRGFKSSGGLGGNTGLIWRRAVANDRALAGANVFLDYETYADENFWRGSAGAELRSAWADVFGNVYRGFSDDVKKNNRTTYTADGYDVELNVHSPELPWLVGEVAYYNFEGKAGDKDDDGVRFGLRFNPLTDLELGVEYDNGDSDDDGKKKWAARIRYSGEFGGVLKAQYRPSTNSGNFEPRDWFFAPVEREYSQRIRKSTVGGSITPTFTFAAANLTSSLPIDLDGEGGQLDLRVDEVGGAVVLMGTINGVAIADRPLTPDNNGLYTIPIAQALTGTVTVSHMGSGTLTLNFPRTKSTVAIGSTVAIATQPDDFFRLINGNAEVMVGGGGGSVFIVEQYADDDNIRRIMIPVVSSPTPIATLAVTVVDPGNNPVVPATHLPPVLDLQDVLDMNLTVETVIDGTMTTMGVESFQASVELANDPVLTDSSPPSYYKGAGAASSIIILGTLRTSGGGGIPYTSSKVSGSGDLVINNGVVGIPTSQAPATGAGNTLVLQIRVNDNPNDAAGLGGQTAEQMVGFTVVYRQITPLAASLPSGIQPIYGVLGDSSRKDVTTAVVSGGPSAFSYSPIDGALRLDAGHVVYIPAGNPPAAGDASTGGNLLTLNSEVRQAAYAGVPAMTVTLGLTVRYIGIPAVSATLTPDAPAISMGQNSFAITAQGDDTSEMNVLVVAGRGGAGGFTMRRTAGELMFRPGTGQVYFSSGTAPRSEAYTLVIEIDDTGTGATETPTYTLTVRVQYDSVDVIRVNFDDADGLVTVYGLQGQATAYANVAQVETGGGFSAITVAKEGSGGGLDLRNGTEIFIPAVLPTGQNLVITVSGNDSEASDPNGITDAALATMTVEYAQVATLNATFSRVNARNGQVGSALGEKVLTVGMTITNPSEFTVAKVVAAGGVGSPYTYTKQSGNGQLDVNSDGEVLIAANTPPGDLSLTVVVQVDDSGDNSEVSPAFLASLTVFYNTIGVIAAEVVDTRNNAVPSVIKADGGTVYFLSAGNNVSTPFGRLEVNGGLGNQFSDYDIVASNESGITYNNRILSMEKCSSGTKSIRFTINDDSVDDGNTTEEIVFDVSLTNECVDAIAAQLKDAANVDATSPLQIYGLEGKTDATVVAAWTATGGGGDLTWSKTGGDLNLTSDNRVQVPQGTSPGDAPNGDALVLTAMVNDEDDKGGFLTAPVVTEMTVNYIEVPAVQLALNDDDDNAITSPVNVYGVESVAKAADKRKVANIAASGGAGGALALSFQTSGDGATTADSFEIVGNNAVNITKAFPAFGASELATVAVVASDSGANSGATPDVTVRATVQILPVLAAVEEGGNIVEIGNADNVVAPTSPSATEANFTVYVLAGDNKHTPPIAQVSAAVVTRNAGVAGASALRIKTPTRHADSTPEASGLSFNGGNPVAQVRINDGATATSGGADLKLVLEYDDEGFAPVHTLTESRRKTVNVHYETVAPFIVQARTADDSAVLPANEAVTAYVAAGATEEVRVARLNQVGGADGMDIVSQSGDLMAKKIGNVFYAVVTANTDIGNTLYLTVMMDDAPGAADNSPERAQGSQTPPVRLELTVAYLETQDVVASFANIPGDDHFLGAADSTSGVRTLYFKDSASRPAELDILRINIQSGSPPYTTDTSGTGFGLDGFNLKDGSNANNRVLALLQAKADGAMAVATVEIDDSGAAAAISDPITLTASVAVKHVEAIEVELIVPEDVPGGPTAGDTLGALYVRSAAAANSSSVHIANASASKGVEQFTYTRQSESSAELLLNDSGEVHLAANYTPDGNKTLSILIAANDSGDGSTLTEAAMLTLEFVLAETIGAVAFLRNNGGAYVPNGTSANDVAWGSGMRTVKVKTADYGNEQLVVGVRGSGGLGNSPAYSIARATGGNENGLVTRTPSPDDYGLGVAVKDGAVASSAPQTFGITAVVNESSTDPNNLTPGATISVTVVYDKVDDIAAAFEDTDGDPIPGRHVVARSEGVSNTDLMVASLNVSGGVGKDTGGDYTFTQDTPGDLIVNSDGEVLVKGGVVPAIGLNLSATVKINDTGNWAHVSDELEVEITVLYSSKVVLDATIVDTRDDAVPANIPRTGGIVYFLNADPDENAVFARVDFSGALPGDDTYVVTASDEVGLSYNISNRELSMTKCTDTPSATKSIKLTANDSPDTAGVSDPLVVEIEVTSGAAQCVDEISARPERLNAVRGAHITDIPKFYRLAGDALDADLPVATVHVDGGAPAYVSDKTGGVLNLVKGSQGELTVVIPSGRAPEASPNNLEIVLTVNDDSTKGGFLTDVAEVKMTVDFAEVQPHGNLQGVLADGVTGSLADGLLTVRRVAASSTPLRIVTNIRPAIPTEERIATEGSFTNFQIVFNTTTNQQDLQLIANQVPDGEVRMITVKVENHKNLASADDEAQFAARPDRLFTIAVRYLGELEAAAYDSETETAIAGDVNRYVESDEGAVAVATVSVSGGTSPYSYNLVAGGLELGTDLTNMTVLIPASVVPSAAPGLKLTARIEINDTNRNDTAPLNVDLTANYILIPGHSDLQLVRDGRTQAEDLDGDTVYPKIVGAKSSGVVEALSGLAFKAGLSGETLKRESSGSAAALLFADDASVVQIAGDTEPDGSTLALVLRASDGESPAQAKARSDRLYTVQVRYMKELTADARTAASGGDVINAVREIRVTEAEADDAHFVAHISVDGGAGGNVIAVEGTNFVISGNELQIAAAVNPGELATGLTLIATVKVNDDATAVGGGETGEVEILVTANYITLPPVAGGFVEGRDGNTAVPTSAPVTVYSKKTAPNTPAPATVAATATAVVDGRSGDTFTFHKVGDGGDLRVDENTGAITVIARRPAGGNFDLHTITVEFSAAINAVNSRQTLTVRHQMVEPIASSPNGLNSRSQCHQGIAQGYPPNRSNPDGTLITVLLHPKEEESVYAPPNSQCSYFAFAPNRFTGQSPAPPYPSNIVRTSRDASGLQLFVVNGNTHGVRLVGTPPTFTAEDLTLSIVIVYKDEGAGGHVVDEFLQTIYVVFPGVPKLEAALETPAGAAIDKPLTVYVAAADASAKLVATVKTSGGEGDGYSYAGTRTGGHATALIVNTDGEIFIPAGFEPVESPGTEFRFEVAVDDTGGDARRRGATPQRKVILTVQYIKTSGPLMAEAVYATPDVYEASSTTFYGAKGVKLSNPLNVASITPSGGIPNPNYTFEIQEDSSNPAANSELEITGSGNERVVQLKGGESGATPSAATSEARRRMITVRVTDTGDVGNSIQPMTMDVVVSVNFVEVTAHADLVVENGGTGIGSDFVVVRPTTQSDAVAVADKVAVADASLSESTTEAADGLSFVSAGNGTLEIDSSENPPTGKTLSIVLIATDGTATPQAAARQDKTYTVSVRYVPAIAAEVQDSSGDRIAAVVELTVLQGVQPAHVVGKIAASGGVTNSYTYAPTAVPGSENLQVDANGDIRIPTGVTPLPGDGRTITVEIAVDDATAADSGETDPANVQITVKYVLLEAPAIEAQNLAGNALDNTNTPTFYRLSGLALTTDMPVAKVAGSKGSGDYTFAIVNDDGAVNANGLKLTGNDGTTLALASGETAAAVGSADRVVTVRLTDTDNRLTSGNTADVIVTVRFEEVAAHADVTFTPQSGITQNDDKEYRVVQAGAPGANVHVLNLVSSDTLSRTEGDAQLVFVAGSPPRLEILDSTPRDGRTLTVVISQTDNDDNDQEIARPDRTYTISVRYIPALAAEARNAADDAVLNAPIVITSKAGLRQVARIAVSGGTSNSYDFTIENLHPAGNDLIVGSSDGIVSIPAEVIPVVGGLALTVRITANDKTDSKDNDATNPASALVTVMYHLLEAPEIEAQNLGGNELTNSNTPIFYLLAGSTLDNDLPVAKVVGSKGSGSYSYAILGANQQGIANGMRVDNSGNEGNIVIVSGETAGAAGSADRIITVELTDTQTTPEKDDVIITVRFEAVNPHADVVFNPVANNNGEHVVVRAGTQQTAVNVASFNTPSGDTLTKAGDAALVLNSGQVQIVGGTAPDAGQTLVAVITQSDIDNTTRQAILRPDRTYTISVRYIPALAAEARDAAGTAALVLTDGTLVIEKESAASLNIASIAVSGGTSSDYDYSIANMHDNNELGVTPEGVVYIPLSVAPLPTDGLSLTVEITANDKTASKDNGATDAVVASITVRYVMDPGLGGQVQDLTGNEATSAPIIYRLVNLAAPSEGLATGLKVVGLRGDTNAYTYANAGNTNPDGLGVDENTGVISILSGQTPDSNQSKVRLLTVKISGVRNGNPREALVTVSVQFLGVGRFGNLQIDNNGVGDAPTNSEGEYVVVRDVSSTGQVIVINSFGISRSDSVVKSAGSPELEVFEISGGNRLRIKSGTVPGGQPPVSGGLTLVAQIKASDDDSDAQDLARPDNDNYFLTVIYLANIAPTLEDAGGTAFPDLTDVDISGPTGGASLFVGNIAATGGDTGESGRYTYNKASGDLELDTTNGQVFISGKTPTAGEGEPLFIEVDVNDTGGDNSDETDAKRIRIDVDYILDPGLGGQVQNLDNTPATSTPTIYRLAGSAAPAEGLATGLKVVGQRGTGYTYAIEGTSPNPDGLSVDASSGVISIVVGQTPDTDASKVRVVTVKISGTRNGNPSDALVTVSVIFRAVNEISGQGFQIQSNDRCSIPRIGGSTFQRNVLPLAEEGTEYSHTNACQFFTLIDESRGSFGFRGGSGGFDKAVVGTPNGLRVDQRGTDLRIQLSSQPVEYTAGRLTLDIVIAYNDNGPAKDLTAEHRKTIEIVLPGIPSVDAVLNDEGGNAIADIAAIEKRGPGNLSVFVGNIVASGGDGNLAIVKDATDGGDLAIDDDGQVYIPDSVQPAAGAGNQLHLLVNINDDGANSGLTKQKQLRIEVDYILQLGLAGQTQDLEDNNVSGEHVVYRQAGVAVPTEGLTVVKVVGERGTSPYTYAVEGDASGSKLVLHTASGSVAIAANETASNQLLELTVRISDNASPPATALHTVSVRFNSVAPHADLTRELATGVTQNSINEYVVVVQGAQSGNVNALSKIKSDEGAALSRIGTDPVELLWNFSPFTNEGRLQLAGTAIGEPTGQTLSFQVVATDGNGEDSDSAEVKAQKTARQDRTFDIAVRYLSHLTGAKLQDTSNNDIDLTNPVEHRVSSSARVDVGDIEVSGGTGVYTYASSEDGGLLLDESNGRVYIPATANPTSEGVTLAITVNVNDDGKDKEVTNGETLEITVNYILEQTTTPLLGQTQDTNGAEVSGEHIVSHAANTQTPSGGLDTGVKVVGQGGTPTYSYAATADDGQLEVGSTSGEVKIKAGQTPSGLLLLLTVRISDSAPTPATALQTVSIRFNSVVSLPAADSGDINLTPLSSIENRVYIATQPGTQLPSRLNHAERITVFTRNSESAAVAVFSVQYLPGSGNPGGVTEGAGSDFSIGQAAGSAKWHPVVLKAENIKRWGQVLQARFVTSDNEGYTVRVLLSEQLEDSALEIGAKGIAGNPQGQNRPMQFNLPDGFSQTSTYPTAPDFQTMVNFPGVTVTGLEVNNQQNLAWRGVRISTTAGGAVAVSRYGSFRWDNDRKELQRRGRPIEGGGRIVYVELWDTGTNPKIIPAILRFHASTRNVPVMAWVTNPSSYTGSASDTIGFEVRGGFQSRNYSPYRDMQATVDAPFVITTTRRTRGGNNDWRFQFEVSIPTGTPAGTYNVNVKVKDRAYTASGELTQPLQVVVQ